MSDTDRLSGNAADSWHAATQTYAWPKMAAARQAIAMAVWAETLTLRQSVSLEGGMWM